MTEGRSDLVIRETLSPMERINISISAASPPEKVREAVSELAKDSVKVGQVDKALKFLIGKGCLLVKQRKLYREFGFHSNEAYLKKEVYRPGLSHGTVWKGIAAVRSFPDAEATRLAQIPEQSLTTAAQMVWKGKLNPKQAAKLLGEAESMPAAEFADLHGREAVRSGYAVIRIVTSKSFKKEFERLSGENPEQFLKELFRHGPGRASSARRLHVA